jgi:hypothetical protein
LIDVGHVFSVAGLGYGAIGGLKRRSGALHESTEGKVIEDFAAISANVSIRLHFTASMIVTYLHTFALPYFRRHSS